MQTQLLDKSAITFSQDAMTAYLRLPEPLGAQQYQVQDIQAALAENGVKTGINNDALTQVVSKGIYNRTVAVATGKQPKDGTDGYYEYFFQQTLDGKPHIKEDGSVDYSIKLFEMVNEGQVIAVYHPAIPGEDGYTVKETPVRCKRGRELPPLRGRGFACQEDGITYVAAITGKIDVVNDKINILPILEIFDDVDINTGNLDFRGDVIIHGSICDDVSIRATGSVTVDGVVQGGSIYANKNILLSGGVLGNSKSVIESKGDISAKFLEFATVRCKGDIVADVFLNTDVYCEGRALLHSSKKGTIVGGTVHAVCGIEANSIGNSAEVRTHVLVGNGGEVLKKMEQLRNGIRAAAENIAKAEELLHKFEEFEEKTGQSCKEDPRRIQLVRIRVRDRAKKAADEEELRKLQIMVDSARGADVRVAKKVYPGVHVSIDTCDARCKMEFDDVIFVKQMDKVVMRKLSEWDGLS